MSEAARQGGRACDITVVIATRRRPGLLAETLRSLAAMPTDALSWELLIVDNAPDSDNVPGRDTQAVVDSAPQTLRIHLLAEPRAGKNFAINRALPRISGS